MSDNELSISRFSQLARALTVSKFWVRFGAMLIFVASPIIGTTAHAYESAPNAIATGVVCFKKAGTFLQEFLPLRFNSEGVAAVDAGGFDPHRCRNATARTAIQLVLPSSISRTIARTTIGVSRGAVSKELVMQGHYDFKSNSFKVVTQTDGPSAFASARYGLEAGPETPPFAGIGAKGKRLTRDLKWDTRQLQESKRADLSTVDELRNSTKNSSIWSGDTLVVLQAPVVNQTAVDQFLLSGTHLSVNSQIRIFDLAL